MTIQRPTRRHFRSITPCLCARFDVNLLLTNLPSNTLHADDRNKVIRRNQHLSKVATRGTRSTCREYFLFNKTVTKLKLATYVGLVPTYYVAVP